MRRFFNDRRSTRAKARRCKTRMGRPGRRKSRNRLWSALQTHLQGADGATCPVEPEIIVIHVTLLSLEAHVLSNIARSPMQSGGPIENATSTQRADEISPFRQRPKRRIDFSHLFSNTYIESPVLPMVELSHGNSAFHLILIKSTGRLFMIASMEKNPVTVARSKLVMSFW